MTTLPVDRKTLALAALKIAQGYADAHIKEEGANNRGAQVGVFQRAAGGDVPESWCMDFQTTCELKALANLLHRPYTAENFVEVALSLHPMLALYHEITGSCGAAMRDAMKRGDWIDHAYVTEIKAGWLVLYAWTAQDVMGRKPQHVGRAKKDWRRGPGKFPDIEGNTGTDGDQSDGDGVYEKARSMANVVGVIRTY